MRKHVKPFVLSLMVLGLVFGSASLVAADIIPITSLAGEWQNPSPASGITINNGTPALITVRWGIPYPPNTQQSGYNFAPVPTTFNVVSDAVNPFALGDFTHLNFPITGIFLTGIELKINMGIATAVPPSFTAVFAIAHNETPNDSCTGSNGKGCPDIVTLVNPFLNAPFTYSGTDYYFNLLGFSQNGGTSITTSWNTLEDEENIATLYGRITTAPIGTPEPLTMLLLGLGLVGLAGFRKRS